MAGAEGLQIAGAAALRRMSVSAVSVAVTVVDVAVAVSEVVVVVFVAVLVDVLVLVTQAISQRSLVEVPSFPPEFPPKMMSLPAKAAA
mmetsp:Transcript_15661/g.47003  ORF Transcript_15661/g.47003 Transcript_15661/m.47003 type:complete len:88 (+) Transcript_15661:93-356(+)